MNGAAAPGPGLSLASALARLEAAIGLVDDVDPTLAPHDTVVAVAAAQGFQGVTDFHDNLLRSLVGRVHSSLGAAVNATEGLLCRWPCYAARPVDATSRLPFGLFFAPRSGCRGCSARYYSRFECTGLQSRGL